MAEKLEEILENLPEYYKAEFFGNSRFVGIEFKVCKPKWGFGAITLSYNIEEGSWHLDDECTSRENVEQFLKKAIPSILDQLYGKGDVKLEYPNPFAGENEP